MVIPRFSIPIVLQSDLNEILTADDASMKCDIAFYHSRATTITERKPSEEAQQSNLGSNILSEISKHLGWYAWLDQNDTFHIHDIITLLKGP